MVGPFCGNVELFVEMYNLRASKSFVLEVQEEREKRAVWCWNVLQRDLYIKLIKGLIS